MKQLRASLPVFWLISFILIFTSCASLDRRKPLEIESYKQKISLSSLEGIKIVFEEVIPGKPLNETVWDNAKGPFWDLKESNQIGFTQDYTKFIPVAATAGIIGGAIGGAISGVAVGPDLVKTRIVIPFGNVFSKNIESAIENNIENYSVCHGPKCSVPSNSNSVLKLKIREFYVWEGPLNHLNLLVKGDSALFEKGIVKKEYEFEKAMLSQKLGGIMSTHASFMKEMNNLSNKLGQDVATDILNNIIK